MKKRTPIIAIDFFCGAGGMTNGLIKAGIHVLAGVDNEAACEKTYRQNKNKDGSRPEYLCKDIFPGRASIRTVSRMKSKRASIV